MRHEGRGYPSRRTWASILSSPVAWPLGWPVSLQSGLGAGLRLALEWLRLVFGLGCQLAVNLKRGPPAQLMP